jgi:ppGpp synthetase/RelA/SpoT-type nucleotidyltranferase
MSDPTSKEVPPENVNAEAVARYTALQNKYEKLATEVEYIVQDALVEERVPVVVVSKRVKSVASFAEKLRRKSYKDPLTDVTDFAGVRIVSYFRGDLARLEFMIQRSFQVLERVDKFAEQETDRFGYRAIHFVVHLKPNYLGARYDELHGLKCEIQIRPVLADAWAILNHHLVYKQETDLPDEAERKINALAALVETAETQFESLRKEIESFRAKETQAGGDEFLNQPVNATTIAAFIERMAPGVDAADKDAQAAFIWSQLDRTRFRTLADIEDAVRRTKKAVLALKKDTSVYPFQELQYALAFADTSMRGKFADWFEALFKKHRHLVERGGSAG